MTNVAGHLREQNGMYQMILSWKDTNGKRRTKSISTGLPVKGNKKRAESLLRKTQKEFNPETMQQVSDLPVSEYLNRWLRESVMNLPPETYGRYAYDLGRVVVPYFEKKRLSLKALSPRDLETALTILGDLGTVNIRRVYGNWKKAGLTGWAQVHGWRGNTRGRSICW